MEAYIEHIIAAFGLVLVLVSLYLTVRHFKIVRAVSYIERFNSPGMAEIRSKVDQWLSSGRDDDDRIDLIRNDPQLRAAVMSFVNLFIELGIAYKFRLVHKKVTFEIWNVLVPLYWNKLAFFVYQSRSEGQDIAREFENLSKDLTAYSKKKAKR